MIYQIEKDGIKGKTWNGGANVLAEIDGYANFIFQIDQEKGRGFKERVAKILAQHNYIEKHIVTYAKEKVVVESTMETKPKDTFLKKLFSIFKK
ncbi:hypothetical protein [Cellulophaga algicola]|uniref:hypothetical protein n=1 Tax=Cellulophaga algicola TaxID=59600 RepID=UPI0002F3993C|nr:hypothetical protein [Cellulophaga algicola]